MKIIITGGSGLLGRALTKAFTDRGDEVVILSRNPEKVSGLPNGARAVAWDGKTALGWQKEADDANALINLAGESLGGTSLLNMRWTKKRRNGILNSRTNAGEAVVEAIKQARNKPAVLIQSSAVGFYGVRGDEKIDESEGPQDEFQSQVCVAWEASSRAVEEIGVRRVVIRTAVVLDNANFAFQMMKLPFAMFVGGPLGNGRQYFPWIHIDDYVNGVLFLLDNKQASGTYNLAAPEPLTNAEIGKVIGRVMRRPYWMPVPGFAMKLALGEVSTVVLDGQRVIPKALQKAGFTFKFSTAEAAVRDLIG